MPAVSRQQYKFFKALEENPEEAKKKRVSQNVAHEFTDGMTKGRFAKLKQKIGKK
jgi:hypothetical protein